MLKQMKRRHRCQTDGAFKSTEDQKVYLTASWAFRGSP